MALVTRTCPVCEREFEVMFYPSDIKHGRGKFCSIACQRKGRVHVGRTNWKGGRVKAGEGRVMVWVRSNDPLACMISHHRFPAGGYVLEHRLVMARSLGRPLLRTESVHHINGDPADNRLENLQLRTRHHGQGQAYCCADCGSRNLTPVPL